MSVRSAAWPQQPRRASGAAEDRRPQDVELREVHQELCGAVNALRAQSSTVRATVSEAAAHVEAEGRRVVDLCAQIERQRRVAPSDPAHAIAGGCEQAALEADLNSLERRLGELQLEEGERRRVAEMRLVRGELELETLAQRAADAERAVTEAAGRAVQPRWLKAEIAEAELALDAARAERGERAPGEEDQRYLEWYRMLNEDKPEHFSLSVVEASCDRWEQSLLDLLAPVAFKSALRCANEGNIGLDRLDAELHDVAAAATERCQRASAEECLQALSEEGTYRLVFAELREAYALVAQLRARNDSLAGQTAALRWRRSGSSATALPASRLLGTVQRLAPETPEATLLPEQGAEVSTKHFPPGPRFAAPVLPCWAGQANGGTAQAAELSRGTPPLLPTSAPSQPRREVVHQPHLPEERGGLNFIYGQAVNRFRPGGAMPLGFESQWNGSAEVAPSQQRHHGPVLGPAELASLAAAAFKEPLSSALGVSPRPSPPPTRPSAEQKPRGNWVTFDSKSGGAIPTAAPTGGFAPLDTAGAGFIDAGQQQHGGPTSGFEDSWPTERESGWPPGGSEGDAWTRSGDAFDADKGSACGAPFPERSAPATGAVDWAENGGEWMPASTAADWVDDAEFQAPTNFGFASSERRDCMVSS